MSLKREYLSELGHSRSPATNTKRLFMFNLICFPCILPTWIIPLNSFKPDSQLFLVLAENKSTSTSPSSMNGQNNEVSAAVVPSKQAMKAARSLTAFTAHFLIAIVVCICLIFAFRNGFWNLSATSQHIILCVLGYQLLMGEAILSLASNSWLPMLNLKQRRRAHWVLQTTGSLLALSGGILKSIDKNNKKGVNWNTLHGRFGLASMIFTTICLLNGLASLYSHELRHILPRSLSKLSHICSGIVASSCASICLCYGFDKDSFRSWGGSIADTVIGLTSVLTICVMVNPLITFYFKVNTFKKK